MFIFDECHRSQFGETHTRIVRFFSKAQLFGFTGTPILAENALGKVTTETLFHKRLHTYVITDAIADDNVLRFSVDYWGKLKRKDGSLMDDDVAGIDVKEFFENPDRIESITDWIIANHRAKTSNRHFTSIFCVSSVDALITYYDTFKRKRDAGEHDLQIATIFTFAANPDDAEANGETGDPDIEIGPDTPINKDKRHKLESYIQDYNKMFEANFSTRDHNFYNYYQDIGKRIKRRDKDGHNDKDRVDILLVVNMFLTGFDAKKVNTLYVDKNLKYHGLIQAFSRTNRILGEKKSHGNIVCFRNLKAKTDEAITLFSNQNADTKILLEPYQDYVDQFNESVVHLQSIAPTVKSVDTLINEEDLLAFVLAFRALMRLKNTLKSFAEFSEDDLALTEQQFVDYSSKYQDIRHRVASPKEAEKVSIIDEVDFELELIHRDEINVAYILALLGDLMELENSLDPNQREEGARKRKTVMDMLGSESQLRSKRELIEEFISTYMPHVKSASEVSGAFTEFWAAKKENAAKVICSDEGLKGDVFQSIVSEYIYSGKLPLRDTIVEGLITKPKILERKTIVERITDKLLSFVAKFDDGIGDI